MVEIVAEMSKRLKIEPEILVLPFKRALKYAETGKGDAIFAIRHTEERAKFAIYPTESIMLERTIIVARKGSGIKITKVDDLKDKYVGVVRGYAYDPEFDKHPGIIKVVSNTDDNILRMLAFKRMDLAAIADEGNLRYISEKYNIEFEILYVLNEIPSYIAISKKAKGEKDGKILAEKFTKVLRQMRKEGVIDKILKP